MSNAPEQVNDTNESTAPVAPAFRRGQEVVRLEEFRHPYDIRVQGSQHEKDRQEYFADLEARRKRAADFEAKRQQVKPREIKVELSAIDEVLNAVEEAIEDFEGPNGYGKPNQPLIDAKIEADRLRRELAEAEARLAENLGTRRQCSTTKARTHCCGSADRELAIYRRVPGDNAPRVRTLWMGNTMG